MTVPKAIADRLYAAPPDGFVAAREEEAAQARTAGDQATAAAIAKLRKPTVAAWLVNLLAIRRPDLIAELAQLAADLRSAQRELRGPALRELSEQRRAAVTALVAQARALARAEAGAPPGKLPLAEVEATLNAVLADAEVAQVVRAGRLVRAVAYTGFGEVPRPQLRLITGGSADAAPTTDASADREPQPDRAAIRRELTDSRTGARQAQEALDRAAEAQRHGGLTLADLESQLAELERLRAAAEEELARLKLARKTAERAVAAARRRLGEAEAAVEALAADDWVAETGRGDRKSAGEAESGG